MTGLLDLPTEILALVATQLKFKDLVNLRQTNKQLREITSARWVWLTQAREYSAKYFNHAPPESGSIDSLSTEELYKWTYKRLQVNELWQQQATSTPRVRIAEFYARTNILVPGGRWFLAKGSSSDCVYAFDLESQHLEPKSC